jgi:hypothetical protein
MAGQIGVCVEPEAGGRYSLTDPDPLTGAPRYQFTDRWGTVRPAGFWRPRVQEMRAPGARCGPDAVLYQPDYATRLVTWLCRLFR